MAKGIAGGLPLSGIVAKNKIMKSQKPGSMVSRLAPKTFCFSESKLVSFLHCLTYRRHILQGGTYAGNALACAAGSAVLDVFKSENILENVNARSKQLFDSLNEIKNGVAKGLISDVRGMGLMVG